MTTHAFSTHRIRRPPAPSDATDPELDPVIIRTLERVADGLPVDRTPLHRLSTRRLVHRHPLARLDRPLVADLTPRGAAELARVYARRSRLALALLASDTGEAETTT